MKQFRVTFTRTLIREVVMKAESIEAIRRVADIQQKVLIDDDFEIEMTTYALEEVNDGTGDEGEESGRASRLGGRD